MATNDSLLSRLHLETFSPEEQQEMLLTLSDAVFRGTLTRLIERMDEKTKEEFKALSDQDASSEQIQAFLAKRVPNANDAIRDTLAEIEDDLKMVGV